MCQKFSCVMLVILNILVLISGVALIITGAVVHWSTGYVQQVLETAFDSASASIGAEQAMFDKVSVLFQEVAGPLGIALLVIGVLLFAIAIICFIGVCCKVRVMVIIYAVIVGLIALAHIIMIIVYFSKKELFLGVINNAVQDLVKKYKSIESGEADSVLFGLLMAMLDCCGFENGEDFKAQGTQFTRRDAYQGYTFPAVEYPVPCCKRDLIGPGANECPQDVTETNSNYKTGCETKLYERAVPILDTVMLGSLVVLAVELFALAMAIVYLCCEDK